MNRVELLTKSLQIAGSATQVFGRNRDVARNMYRRLAKELHPDTGADGSGYRTLSILWDEYLPDREDMILRRDEVATIVEIPNLNERKYGRSGDYEEYLQNEITVTQHLQESEDFRRYEQLIPTAIGGPTSNSSEIFYLPSDLMPSHLVNLTTFYNFYGKGFDVRHIGWIWHRILWALEFVHRNGVVHGAVIPDNILIGPSHHDVVLGGWYYSSMPQEPIRAISNQYLSTYPLEIKNIVNNRLINGIDTEALQRLTVPQLDIYMAAKCMLLLCQDHSPELTTFFKGYINLPYRNINDRMSENVRAFDDLIFNTLEWPVGGYIPCEWLNWESERHG